VQAPAVLVVALLDTSADNEKRQSPQVEPKTSINILGTVSDVHLSLGLGKACVTVLDRGSSEFGVCDAQYITPQVVSPSLIWRLQATPLYRRDPHTPQSLHTIPRSSAYHPLQWVSN
jgi:hypothetical protein